LFHLNASLTCFLSIMTYSKMKVASPIIYNEKLTSVKRLIALVKLTILILKLPFAVFFILQKNQLSSFVPLVSLLIQTSKVFGSFYLTCSILAHSKFPSKTNVSGYLLSYCCFKIVGCSVLIFFSASLAFLIPIILGISFGF